MREENGNWFARWEEELPSPEELIPLSQTLISPDLAMAFDIRNPNRGNANSAQAQQQGNLATATTPPPPPSSQANSSAEFAADSADLGSGGAGDEPARTLKRPRLVWTPQLHKRFVDAVAQLGIKNAVPKTIMQLMSVDGLTRENVASHLQKYRLYLKRMQGLSGPGGANGGGGSGAVSDPTTDHLFASSPVPAHFLHHAAARGAGPDHFMQSFVPIATLQQQQQMAAAAAVAAQHQHLQPPQYHRQMGHFGSPSPSGQFEHSFLARQTPQQIHRMSGPLHSQVGGGGGYVEDLESANANGGRKVLTLFPTGDD